MGEYICEADFFLQSNFQFPFTHRKVKGKTTSCSPQDLCLIYIKNFRNLEKGNTLKYRRKNRKGKKTSSEKLLYQSPIILLIKK